jgi:hypothetical protein
MERLGRNVFRVNVPIIRNKSWDFHSLLAADQHHDNPAADNDMELRHLWEAKELGAAVISAGDTFCAMQGKYDKRSSKSSVKPEHQVDNYLDALVDSAADFYAPFAHNFVCFGVGNHEDSITNRHETRLIDRLVGALNHRTGSSIHVGGFSGWVIFQFYDERITRGSIVLHFDHGYGGGGPITSDMIQHFRRSVYLPDADIVISGHTHDAWVRELARVRLSEQGTISHDIQTHIKLPTYKDEYKDGFAGWHATTGKPPKPLGAWWLRFFYDRARERVGYEVRRAQ